MCIRDRYSNDANWMAHYETTGPEIWRQTEGRVTHFVAGLGTSGTFMGTTRKLKEFNPAVQAISFQPDSPFHGLEGLKYMATSIVPAIYNPHLADRQMTVETEAAYEMAKQLAREEGLLVGISAAAAVVASVQIARDEAKSGRRAVIVTVLPDSADKYLSERFWDCLLYTSGLRKVSLRPLRRMVGMRVIKTGDVQALAPCLALNLHQLSGRNVIAVMRRICSRIPGLHRCFDAPALGCRDVYKRQVEDRQTLRHASC